MPQTPTRIQLRHDFSNFYEEDAGGGSPDIFRDGEILVVHQAWLANSDGVGGTGSSVGTTGLAGSTEALGYAKTQADLAAGSGTKNVSNPIWKSAWREAFQYYLENNGTPRYYSNFPVLGFKIGDGYSNYTELPLFQLDPGIYPTVDQYLKGRDISSPNGILNANVTPSDYSSTNDFIQDLLFPQQNANAAITTNIVTTRNQLVGAPPLFSTSTSVGGSTRAYPAIAVAISTGYDREDDFSFNNSSSNTRRLHRYIPNFQDSSSWLDVGNVLVKDVGSTSHLVYPASNLPSALALRVLLDSGVTPIAGDETAGTFARYDPSTSIFYHRFRAVAQDRRGGTKEGYVELEVPHVFPMYMGLITVGSGSPPTQNQLNNAIFNIDALIAWEPGKVGGSLLNSQIRSSDNGSPAPRPSALNPYKVRVGPDAGKHLVFAAPSFYGAPEIRNSMGANLLQLDVFRQNTSLGSTNGYDRDRDITVGTGTTVLTVSYTFYITPAPINLTSAVEYTVTYPNPATITL